MTSPEFEDRILRFEQAWQQRTPLTIAEGQLPPVADPTRLLVELIALDLEYRWRNPSVVGTATLDDYREHLSTFDPADRPPRELIAEEYRVRTLWGDRPTHAAILGRDPGRADQIRPLLQEVDAALAAETRSGPPASRPPLTAGVEFDPGLPWSSHRDFLLRRMVGAGGMGKVFEATDHRTGETVAVKFLRKTWSNHPGAVARFLTEARTVARLRHPNIVGLRGLGRTGAGGLFLVMDWVDGSNLAEVGRDRAITVAEAIRWTVALCDALEYAHAQGVIHCDLKPANLLRGRDGWIRVTDFGLARSVDGAIPVVANLEGTAPFMAPEQVSPAWGPIDPRTDVYGVGAVLFALLTGRPPHLGRRLPDVLAAVVAGMPVAPVGSFRPDLDPALASVCAGCLRKPPSERWPTIAAVRAALLG